MAYEISLIYSCLADVKSGDPTASISSKNNQLQLVHIKELQLTFAYTYIFCEK